jgi:hypothetical protein
MTSPIDLTPVPWEWQLTDEGRWQPIDPIKETHRLVEASKQLVERNRRNLDQARELCARIESALRRRRAWRLIAPPPTVQ